MNVPQASATRSTRIALLLGQLALSASLVACETTPTEITDIAEDAVVKIAKGDESAVGYFRADFVDHQSGTTGTDALREQLSARHTAHPDATVEVYRVLDEKNLVFVHSHLTLDDGTRGLATADVFRFEGGKIAEHWGNRQEVPETTASGNDMFSTLSAPSRLDPDPASDPAVTSGTMAALATALIVDKDLGAWDKYVQPPYYQHSINTPNGVEAVKEIWGPIIADPTVVITPVTSITDGDLFVTMNLVDSPTLHMTTVDLSRVREGLIVEHWDVVELRQ